MFSARSIKNIMWIPLLSVAMYVRLFRVTMAIFMCKMALIFAVCIEEKTGYLKGIPSYIFKPSFSLIFTKSSRGMLANSEMKTILTLVMLNKLRYHAHF